jgi:hypothetical protein
MAEQWVTMFGQGNSVTVESGAVTIRPGLGRHQLCVNLVLRPANPIAYDRSVSVGGRVDAAGLAAGGGYLGTAPRTLPQRLYANGKSSHDLMVDLDLGQIYAIERRRNGGFSLNLQLELFGSGTEGDGPEYATAYMQDIPVTRESWLAILEQIRYRQTMLVELTVPDAQSSPTVTHALRHFSDAQRRLLEGQYRQTVESLRQALAGLVGKDVTDEDSAEAVADSIRTEKKKSFESRVEYEPRYELVRQALKFLTDLGAHPEVTDTSPAEARSALTMVAGLLQWYGDPLGR